MRKIAVFTGTRAEYGLLFWLLKAIAEDTSTHLQLIVSGAHLSPAFGETWQAIEQDGFQIDANVDMLISSNRAVGIVKSMGVGLIGIADALDRLKPDCLIVLGDRVEVLMAAQAALILKIPIIHLHGGELTLGAYDDAIRHAVSKMASLHFVATEIYRQRLLRMGEHPAHVHHVGALGLEHCQRTPRLDFATLVHDLNIPLKQPYFLVTLHPVTLIHEPPQTVCGILFDILQDYADFHVLFTYPNADNGSYDIIHLIEAFCQNNPRAFIMKSLGYKHYLSAVAHAHVVVGNSSSGIIEVPSFHIPSINIGTRQLGRLAAASVIHATVEKASLKTAFQQALDVDFRESCQHTKNPYGDGVVSTNILNIIKQTSFSFPKPFFDGPFPEGSRSYCDEFASCDKASYEKA